MFKHVYENFFSPFSRLLIIIIWRAEEGRRKRNLIVNLFVVLVGIRDWEKVKRKH